ncbi:MAG: cyclic nucleotide-binding domain-containing protein [Bdellovibrionota bacterium]
MSDKLVFMVAEADRTLCDEVVNILKGAFEGCTVYSANEGSEALKKVRNVPPKVLISGMELGSKVTFHDMVRNIDMDRGLQTLPIVVLSDIVDTEPKLQGDLAKGRIKFLSMPMSRDELIASVKGFLQSENLKNNSFRTVILKPGDALFSEGEKAESAFLVKSGKLEATRKIDDQVVVLGQILAGEFVGEMAHITGEPRNANVKALEASELVEIPCGTLDLLIFSKPTWTKSLLKTLCRRLREANQKLG